MQKIKAKKALGQNFLIDEEALSDIAGAIEISNRHIIEVGPGYGALTDHLVTKNPTSLDLVELDQDMVEILNERFIEMYPPEDKIQDSRFDTKISGVLDPSS
jgi:16S rRNA (adenine1518-N6/adenine1519-N6)-dimethyltransferase